MGLFDKVKSGLKGISDRVTGGYGEVALELHEGPVAPGEMVRSKLSVTAKGELKVDAIVLAIEGWESSEYDKPRLDEDAHERACVDKNRTVRAERRLEESFELGEGETREFDVELEVPSDARMTYEGNKFKHEYKMTVQVDVPWGVDLCAEAPFKVFEKIPETPEKVTLEYADETMTATLTVDDCVEADSTLRYEIKWKSANGKKHEYPPFCEYLKMEEKVFCTLYEPEGEGERLVGQDWSIRDNRIYLFYTLNSRKRGCDYQMDEDGLGGTVTTSQVLGGPKVASYSSDNFQTELHLQISPFEEDEDGNERLSEPAIIKVFPKPVGAV